MSSLTMQLEELKIQQQELEERIQKEKETKQQQLEYESSIERIEALVQPLTDALDAMLPDNVPCPLRRGLRTPTYRDKHTCDYDSEMHWWEEDIKECHRAITKKKKKPFDLTKIKGYPHPQKDKQLLDEEIYTTIISILKKQEKKIEEISSKVNKYFGNLTNEV